VTVVTFSLFGFTSLRQRLWAFSQMGLAKPSLRKTPDLGFFKLMGTGSAAGFSTRPNFGVYTLLAQWPSLEIARERIGSAKSLSGYRKTADRTATVYLEPVSTRGQWDGHQFEIAQEAPEQRLPLVAMTRASIRLSKLIRFWREVPAISDAVEREPNRRFMIGTGEIPWLHQVTFSLWSSVEEMERFARTSPTHGEAVRRAYQDNWFSEYCFTRFNLLAIDGRWEGLTDMTERVETPVNDPQDSRAHAARLAAAR
jgi:spheroidene monooxygenase